MAVTPPGTFARIQTGPGGPFGHAQDAGPSLSSLLANHNHLYAAMGTPIGMAHYSGGWAGHGPDRDVLLFRRPADPDRRPLVARILAANSSGGSHTLSVADGATVTTLSVPSSSATWREITWTPDSAAEGWFAVRSDNTNLVIYSATVHRTVLSGSISDAPKASGYRWAQASAESATDEPVSVELLNRVLAAPRQIELAQPVGILHLCDSPEATRLGVSDSASEATLLAGSSEEGDGPHALLLGASARRFNGRLWVAGRQRFGTVTGIVTVTLSGISRTLSFTGGATVPSSGGPYQWQSVDLDDVPPGLLAGSVSCRGAEVWAVHLLAR
jgi:hypothetical protein